MTYTIVHGSPVENHAKEDCLPEGADRGPSGQARVLCLKDFAMVDVADLMDVVERVVVLDGRLDRLLGLHCCCG